MCIKTKITLLTLILGVGELIGLIPIKTDKNASTSVLERKNEVLEERLRYILEDDFYLKAINTPNYEIKKEYIFADLIDCLIEKESEGRNICIIDTNGKPSCGILQFQRRTFNEYCVNKFNLENNIRSDNIQKTCADLMLQENFNNLFHWSTAKKCLKVVKKI